MSKETTITNEEIVLEENQIRMTVYSYYGKGSREINEDYIKSEPITNGASLHIVADGMGGYKYGEVASQVATEAIFQFITENGINGNIHTLIEHAVEYANEQILIKRNQLHTKLGTTIAGILIKDNTAYAFWLGDVQIQHFRDNKQLFISESHSLINEMKNKSSVSSKDIERYKNFVTRSLSGTPLEESIPIVEIHFQQEDIICISSDGFYNSINPFTLISKSDSEIVAILKDIEDSNQDNFSIIELFF